MAYNYKPNKYTKYDDSLTFEENYQNDAVITKEKLDKLEQQVKYNSADIGIGEVKFVETIEEASVTVEFNKVEGTKRFNFAIPVSSTGGGGEITEVDIKIKNAIDKALKTVFTRRKTEPYATESGTVFACGNAIIVDADPNDDTKNIISWYSQDGNINMLSIPANQDIYGGSKETDDDTVISYPSTSITINSGRVANVFGGGNSACDIGNAFITINGGTISGRISGAGCSGLTKNNKVGYAHIVLNNCEGTPSVYGGSGEGYGTLGEVLIEVNGGNYNYITAGSSDGYTQIGKVVVNKGNIKILQGCNRGSISNVEFEINGGTIDKMYAYGKGNANPLDNPKVYHSKLTITGGTITELASGVNALENKDATGTYVDGVIGNQEAALVDLSGLVKSYTQAQLMDLVKKALDAAGDATVDF